MAICRILFPVILLINGLSLAGDGDAPEGQPAKFKIVTRRTDDQVGFRAEKDKGVFSVKSPFGIGQAVIERIQGKWPGTVILRLHLKGLESLQAANGKATLDAAISNQEGKARIRLWKDGKEDTPLDEKSPFWTAIRILGRDGKPAQQLPLKEGYFEIVLPKALFAGDPKSITVRWIDSYR